MMRLRLDGEVEVPDEVGAQLLRDQGARDASGDRMIVTLHTYVGEWSYRVVIPGRWTEEGSAP